MIRVGFIGLVSREWMGGINYLNNLLFAVSNYNKYNYKYYVFIGKKTDLELKRNYSKYANVIEDSIFDKFSMKWILMKLEQTLLQSNFVLEYSLRRHEIDVLSHTLFTNFKQVKTIGWIPDFQHIHLPHMFSQKELRKRDALYHRVSRNCDALILSSYSTLKDYEMFTSEYNANTTVLQFVSQPETDLVSEKKASKNSIRDKFNITGDFFYLPNQFWKHKNHRLVFEAIHELKIEGSEITLICTGHLLDYRNREYLNELTQFIECNDLQSNIRLLGLLEYRDVYRLMRSAKAVINPSLFEGWSSTVEECKSIGKQMILSDIDVHKEQYETATFFEPDNVKSLKDVLRNFEEETSSATYYPIKIKTKEFAVKYQNVVKKLF